MKKLLLFFTIAFSFSLYTYSQIGIAQPTDYEVCDDNGDGFAIFDFSIKDSEILNGLDPISYIISYHDTIETASNGTNGLVNPYVNETNPQTIYARVFELSTGNFEVTSFDLIVNSAIQNGFSSEQIACGADGFAVFDLSISSIDLTSGDPNLVVSYYLTFQDALDNINPIPNIQSFTNTVPYYQEIYFRIENMITGCFFASPNTSLYLNVVDQPDFNSPSPLEACDLDSDGIEEFDLYSKTAEIIEGSNPNQLDVTYHETIADADNDTNALSQYYTNITPSIQTIYVRVTVYYDNCYQVLPLDLVVNTDCISASSVEAIVCGDDPNIPVDYDLTSQEANMLNGQNPTDFTFEYYLTQSNADNQTNPLVDPNAYTVSGNSSFVYVRIEDNTTGNFIVVQIFVNFSLNPQIDFNGPYFICSGNEVVLIPAIGNNNGAYSYLWDTGETTQEIIVNTGGTYTVTVNDLITGCSSSASVEVVEDIDAPLLTDTADISSCVPNTVYDLTATIPEILNGQDASQFIIDFFDDANSAFSNTNAIFDASNYLPLLPEVTIYVRVQNNLGTCFSITDFTITTDNSCPVTIDCTQPVNNSFCYVSSQITEFSYVSSDNSRLQLVFNAGQLEVNYDALVVIDSDGITNLNPVETTYGNNGDLTGLSFVSTGDSIRVRIEADDSISCFNQNYTPIDYNVSCFDVNAVPTCNVTLQTPEDGEMDVLEITDLSWSNASGIVEGYKLSIGLTSGGTEVIDNEDVGNITTYDLETLDFETTYFVTIVPYNTNGDAEACTEQSFTTRANPNQIIVCEDGALNTTYCYDNDDTSEFSFQSSDGLPLTIIFNSGSTEVTFDEVYIVDSDGTVLNPNLLYGNDGDFTGLTYTTSGDSLTVRFDSDFSISCTTGSGCCTEQFDFDVFCASSVGFIQVNAFVDANGNSIYDTDEFSFSNGYFTYEINGDGMINTVNSSTGHFQIISGNETDVYNITFNLYDESEACYDITTAGFNNISVPTGNTVTVDFPVVEEQSCEDLAVYLINNWAPPRPGFTHNNYLYLENLGFTNISSGTVEFVLDPQLVFNNTFSVNPAYTITNTSTGFTVDFVNLQPGDVESIGISMTCPVSVALGDIVTNTATYLTDTNDLVSSNNYSTLSEVVVGSWDPNDKMESHGPVIVYDEFIISDEWLYYTIRFQNLGTAEAIFVRIEDVIDDQLNKDTFQMLRASHDYVVTRTDNDLEWYFENINLPAEQDDAEGSIGFVYFRIKPMSGYAVGDVIPNTAAIYFDFNAPVITNRFETQFVEPLSVNDFETVDFSIYPNPANEKVTISVNGKPINEIDVTLFDLQGKILTTPRVTYNGLLELNISSLNAGIYFLQLRNSNQTIVEKLIIE